ncbi:extracellular solute-binding protein [Paenibacillus puerhi]|uniref:extracellular solute-binding protein n=1 Tax=Paenibacillus puerhi TaxID=2692622 RepID=UPI00135A2C31|nr:extracellular solute-binding protein [Paenibacillus puerhi]
MKSTHRSIIRLLPILLLCNLASGCKEPQRLPEPAEKPAMTYWSELNANAGSVVPSFQEVPFFQEWQKRTGVHLRFIQPPANQAQEALHVLLASGELPDMIEYEWNRFPGGPEKAIQDGYILRLNDLIDKHAPNLKKYLQEHPEVDRQLKTADGSYYVFPFIRGDDLLRTYQGPLVRKDWLDELGIPIPVTMDDWYTVLKAFKEKKGVQAPLTFLGVPNPLFGIESGAFTGAFGVKKGFYMDEGVVKYGPLEAGYKQFLLTFRKWYAEGLIDRNFATVDTTTLDANILTGRSGATLWNVGAGIGKWQPLLQAGNSKAWLEPTPYPVLKQGVRPRFGQRSHAYEGTGGVAISRKSRHAEEAANLLDYGYSPEGHMLFNFGVEGVSYQLVDGHPKYTDLILRNPDKLAPSQALAMFTRASYFGPFVQDVRYMEQYYTLPQQQKALRLWSDTDADVTIVPQVSMSKMDSAEFASIMNEVATLVDEASLKMILGIDSPDAFDEHVHQMKDLKIGRAIQLLQLAVDRNQVSR